MKKSDFICIAGVLIFFLPFFLFDQVFKTYQDLNHAHPYLLAYIKFFLLAPFGEMLGMRIRTGQYLAKGFGWFPRAVIWGFLGVTIKMAFDIFAAGVPNMLSHMGFNIPNDVLAGEFSAKKLFTAISIGITINIFYAPMLMVTHKITDEHIKTYGGKAIALLKPIAFGKYLVELDWKTQWSFTFTKAIPFFWIPAQSLNFLLPADYRILVAALYSIVLGILLAIVSLNSGK